MPAFLVWFRTRIERSCAQRGITYPWWIPAYSTLGILFLAVAATVQRDALFPPTPVALAGLLAVAPMCVWAVRGWLAPPWLEALAGIGAVALFLTHPVEPDFAPLLLMAVAGEVAATSRMRVAMAVAGAGIAVLVVGASVGQLSGAPLYVIGVVLGADVGIALRWQMRALNAERANTAIAQEQAVLAERQRLAREVHDVVGHSLSITLLHVTGARHSLQQHDDIADAVEALTEAERVGRAAMADMRRTVGLLASGPSGSQALPGVDDLSSLVERSRAAGLDVTFERSGGATGDVALGDAAGLGLYRIAQESLANIAKHAPTAKATVHLAEGADATRLAVRNSLPGGVAPARSGGSGLPGMAARAHQIGASLHAGQEGDGWLVEVVLPAVAQPHVDAVPDSADDPIASHSHRRARAEGEGLRPVTR